MTAPFAALDQTELLQLALDASRNRDAGAALTYLKEAVSRTDATAGAHYLLGAEYAQIGLLDRAVAEMESAIALDPSLSAARFQLGLLLLSSGDSAGALKILQPLAALGAHNPLAQFGSGLTHLIRDEFADAMRCLAQGIALNIDNQALNEDMHRIIDEIRNLPAENIKQGAAKNPSGDINARHIFLSAYTGNGNNPS